MNFVINSTKTEGQMVKCSVTYTLDNGYVETVEDLPISQPPDFSYIINGIHSRGLTIQSQHG